MNRGFVFCAVLCSALALTVYAGLYGLVGISAGMAVVLLVALCLIFHGAAMYLFSSSAKPETRSETGEENSCGEGESLPAVPVAGERGKVV